MAKDKKVIARQIVTRIVDDLEDRSGLQNEWEAIDLKTRRKILEEWTQLALECLENE